MHVTYSWLAQSCALDAVHMNIPVLACINGNLSTNLEEKFGVQKQAVADKWKCFGEKSCEEACL